MIKGNPSHLTRISLCVYCPMFWLPIYKEAHEDLYPGQSNMYWMGHSPLIKVILSMMPIGTLAFPMLGKYRHFFSYVVLVHLTEIIPLSSLYVCTCS